MKRSIVHSCWNVPDYFFSGLSGVWLFSPGAKKGKEEKKTEARWVSSYLKGFQDHLPVGFSPLVVKTANGRCYLGIHPLSLSPLFSLSLSSFLQERERCHRVQARSKSPTKEKIMEKCCSVRVFLT